MRVIKRKDAGSHERISGANGAVNNGRYAVATAVQDRERQRRLAEQMRDQVENEHVDQ